MKNLIFFANWKMNMDIKKSHIYIQAMLKKVSKKEQNHFVFLSPAFLLPFLKESLKNSHFNYGGQNCYFEDKGSFTGENSPLVLKQLGATYNLVGHSERRHLFFENNLLIQKKAKALLRHNIQPIICVGETSEERKQGQTFKVLEKQITPVLKTLALFFSKQTSAQNQVSFKKAINIYIAYEPVWAIGKDKSATLKDITSAYAYIQKLFKPHNIDFNFLYGGSVNKKNAPTLAKIPGVCGFLVGGASLEPDTFLSLYRSCVVG